MSRPKRLDELFKTIDAKDTEGFMRFLTPDGVFRFGNAPPVQGHDAIRDAVGGFFDSIRALAHTIDSVWFDDDSIVCDGEVTYIRKDGSELTVPFADVFRFKGNLIDEYLVYIDASELYR